MDATKIELVQSSFAKVVPIADKAAEIFYAKLFERDPALKSLFKGDMTQQGNKLMTMIGAAVNGLNNLEALVPVVQNLGRNHVGYGVTESMYSDVGAALIDTLQTGLGDEFTEETKSAWIEVYILLSDTMKAAAKEVEDEPGLTPYKVKLVQDSFAKVVPIADQAAEIFYGKLFELDPSLKSLFSGDMVQQGKKLMNMIGTAVSGLTDLGKIVPAVQDLGRRHTGYGVTDQMYDTVGTALLYTLETGLGDAFTSQVKGAWTEVYTVLSTTMKDAAAEVPAKKWYEFWK